MLARIPADVSKRLVLPILALGLLAAACGEPPPVGEVDFGSGRQFVPEVADSIDNVGLGASVVLNADGVPYVAYLGFPAELAEGEIAVSRLIGAPFVPGVLLASQAEGVWNRGAVAMFQDPPDRVDVPFGPATVESLADATPENTNGTDIAVAADGSLHAVWAAHDGIWYATGPDSFTATQVIPQDPPLDRAGPIGWPSVAVAQDGTPWIAATISTDGGQQVVAATPSGDAWEVQTVAELAACAACPDAARTGIVATPDGPVVIYADPAGGVTAARLSGRTWTAETVESGVDGTAISASADADGAITAAYYASRGSVHVASSDGGGWQTTEAASVSAASASPSGGGDEASVDGRGTGVDVTDDGAVYLTYVDPGANAVMLSSSADGSKFEPIETRATEGGRWPDVSVSPDGATVSLAWYAPDGQDLAFGTYDDVGDIKVAAPSPPFAVSTGAATTGECTEESVKPVTDIELVAPVGAAGSGFDTSCIVSPAGEELSLTFDNQDPGIPHNADFLTEAGGDELFSSGALAAGPETQTVPKVDPQDPGTYYFQCEAHPTTMNGTFLVVKASKK
jgi:plastocyanin